jgi:hypothetical protein
MTESTLRAGVQLQTSAANATMTNANEISRQLNHGELRQLRRSLQRPPQQLGFLGTTWTAKFVQRYVRDSFTVAYSRPFIDQLVKTVGIAHRFERRDV